MTSPSIMRMMRPLRRRMVAIATATAAGLLLTLPGVASADSTSATMSTATPAVVAAPTPGVASPDSDSWSTPADAGGFVPVQSDYSDSWS